MMTVDRTLETLMAVPELLDARASPDGRWLAWAWGNLGPSADVWLAPTDRSAAPRRLTDIAEEVRPRAWAPDGRWLVVAVERDGDEKPQLHRLDRDGGMTPLTAGPPCFLRGGDPHPNGRWLVYAADYDFTAGRPIASSWIWRHDIGNGVRLALARPRVAYAGGPSLNSTGTYVLYTRKDLHPAGRQLWLVDIEGREDREIVNLGAATKVSGSWCPDGRRIVVVAFGERHKRVGLWHLDDGRLTWLIDDPGRSIEGAFMPDRSPRIVLLEAVEARLRASLLDPDSRVERPVSAAHGSLLPLAPLGADDGPWLARWYHAGQPDDLVRLDPAGGALSSLTGLALPDLPLAPAESVRWTSRDGLSVQGWLFRAREPARGMIVHVHGGPTAHSEDRFSEEVQYYVACGFHVLRPNYRGSTGFGLAFREAIKRDGWGGLEQDDILTGVQTMLDRGIARPGKVGITGTSYGGYSAWCAITRAPTALIAAAAPICGMTDLVVDYETTRPDLRPYSEEMMGGSPAEVPERYRERSPINFVGNIKGRLLIVQGLNDPNVTPANLEAVAAALDRHGIAYETLTFADEGHGIAKPENCKRLYRRLADFFAAAFG
jgi:dipeptidyl aminopeptidase/acylaminoacyl peptidase